MNRNIRGAGRSRPNGLAWLLILGLSVSWIDRASGQTADRMPASANPAAHVYPALGMTAERRVDVAWNRFYDHTGLGAILEKLHRAFPDLTRVYSVGKSVEGRDLWCLEVSAMKVGNPARKPGIYIDGNIHGNEVQAGEVVAYTAWYLCHQYGRVEKVTELLEIGRASCRERV